MGDPFSNAYRVEETLWEMLNKSCDLMGAFPSGSPASRKQKKTLCLMPTVSPHISGDFSEIQFGEITKNLKAISSSSPVFALSNYTTVSQTQTDATVPLNRVYIVNVYNVHINIYIWV
jgi:hypothetical protein